MQWFLWGCAVVGAVQAFEAVRLIRSGGKLALHNLWVAGLEFVWLVVCAWQLLFEEPSAPERWMALVFIVAIVLISLLAQRLGYYDGLQARIEQANNEQPGSMGLEHMRMQPALVLPCLAFGCCFSGAALWLLA